MRPKASEENRAIALAFAQCVTAKSDLETSFVARHGKASLFACFDRVCPSLTREPHEPRPANRQGVSEPEFNKALEKKDGGTYIRARNRLLCNARATSGDDTESTNESVGDEDARGAARPLAGAGSWMFTKLRWKNPDNEGERRALTEGLQALARERPALQLDVARAVGVVGEFHEMWLRTANPSKKPGPKRKRKLQPDACDDERCSPRQRLDVPPLPSLAQSAQAQNAQATAALHGLASHATMAAAQLLQRGHLGGLPELRSMPFGHPAGQLQGGLGGLLGLSGLSSHMLLEQALQQSQRQRPVLWGAPEAGLAALSADDCHPPQPDAVARAQFLLNFSGAAQQDKDKRHNLWDRSSSANSSNEQQGAAQAVSEGGQARATGLPRMSIAMLT